MGLQDQLLCLFMLVLGWGRPWLPFQTDLSSRTLSSWWYTPLIDNSSMEMGSILMLLRLVSFIQDHSYLPCGGTLCRLITAGGFWAWVTHFPLKLPILCTPLFFPRTANTEYWCIFKPVAVSWLSQGCSKGHSDFRSPTPTAWKELCMDNLICSSPIADIGR